MNLRSIKALSTTSLMMSRPAIWLKASLRLVRTIACGWLPRAWRSKPSSQRWWRWGAGASRVTCSAVRCRRATWPPWFVSAMTRLRPPSEATSGVLLLHLAQKLTDVFKGLFRLRQQGREDVPYVHHVLPCVKLHRRAFGTGFGGISGGVVQQHFRAAGVNQGWRQVVKVSAQGRRHGIGGGKCETPPGCPTRGPVTESSTTLRKPAQVRDRYGCFPGCWGRSG